MSDSHRSLLLEHLFSVYKLISHEEFPSLHLLSISLFVLRLSSSSFPSFSSSGSSLIRKAILAWHLNTIKQVNPVWPENDNFSSKLLFDFFNKTFTWKSVLTYLPVLIGKFSGCPSARSIRFHDDDDFVEGCIDRLLNLALKNSLLVPCE